MQKSICYIHTNLVAQDWNVLADFYENVLGCEKIYPERDLQGIWLEQATGVAQAHIQGIHLRLPGYEHAGPTLEIFQYNAEAAGSEKKINRSGLAHLAFRVHDVPGYLEKIIKHGGSQVGEIARRDIPGLGMITFVYAADPEGNIIELQSLEK